MDQSAIEALVKRVVSLSDADETEVLFSQSEENLTRFSNNAISQNVGRTVRNVTVKVHIGKRVGKATTDLLDSESLQKVVTAAISVAKQQSEIPNLLPLTALSGFKVAQNAHFVRTAEFSPEERAASIRHLVENAQRHDATAAGIFSTGGELVALANSKGLFGFHNGTSAVFSATVEKADGSGWAEDVQRDVDRIDIRQVTDTAIRKALDAGNPQMIDPGPYTVVLEPAAASDFLMFMAFEGFGGLNYLEGRSFLSGHLGERIMGRNVTITDDAFSPLNPGLPFDFEGMPRQKVMLIEDGIAKAVVHDRISAEKCKTISTGHSLPQPNSTGALPLNLVMQPGESTVEEMIASTERGILVTHFHYTNVLDPIRLSLTGMTRDGTFLIEKGKIKAPVRNLRFTESVVEAFNRIELISKDQLTANAFFAGSFVVPALKINQFNFSSVSEF